MKNQIITEEIASYFKKPYYYKMGGCQNLVFPGGETFKFNDKQYYSGRGSKYNSSIKYENKGIIEVSKKEVREYFKMQSDRKKLAKKNELERKNNEKRYNENLKNGVYGLKKNESMGYMVELSEKESELQTFDTFRLAATLGINTEDCEKLKSKGKTYVFAKNNEGKIIRLYHSSLFCNSLTIWVDFPTENEVQEFTKNWESWRSAPYSNEVGQSDYKNHFVC